MKHLTRYQLVEALKSAAKLLEKYGRCVQDSRKKGIEPRDALALGCYMATHKLKETRVKTHEFAQEFADATENYKTVRAEWGDLDAYRKNAQAAIEFYIGKHLSFYRATAERFKEVASWVEQA